ncbi:MAG TPA: FaeA/PapI family transcriptional regulator [Candidatus Thermoplasmatota archaeon]|nr:FaeA/PapI family transcriptional regulator [Candidatus Thermoplasmatota archaeon]
MTAREEIIIFLRTHPGSAIVDIAEAAGLSHATARYHLAQLESRRRALSERWGHRRFYFPPGFDAWERRVATLLAPREGAAVLKAVAKEPWLHAREIARRERLSRHTVAGYLRRFAALGLVARAHEGRERYVVLERRASTTRRATALAEKLPRDHPGRAVLERWRR